MTKSDLDLAISWAAKEGWNPGLHDRDAFYNTDSKGFFMGFFDDKPISCISAVSYGKDFGFIGFYIVHSDHRNKGYGIKIWNKAIDYLKTQNIGLDGVLAQQENYKKSGFKLAYRNIRYQGMVKKYEVKNDNLININTVPFNELVRYDYQLFPVPRPKFLKYWIKEPESLTLGFLKNDKLFGYGMIRKCVTGYKVGPLFADDKIIAENIFKKLNNFAVGSLIFLDIPEVNKEALKLVNKYKMKSMFETARMYTKQSPDININKVFGVTTFELG
ncbi:GNAT family N-acetyltransferase [Candidatus Roizmanbacteria bacterium]|nr:GNAT family N-acetyltransferase [Candidatus Roizmanbacteria bacterium]